MRCAQAQGVRICGPGTVPQAGPAGRSEAAEGAEATEVAGPPWQEGKAAVFSTGRAASPESREAKTCPIRPFRRQQLKNWPESRSTVRTAGRAESRPRRSQNGDSIPGFFIRGFFDPKKTEKAGISRPSILTRIRGVNPSKPRAGTPVRGLPFQPAPEAPIRPLPPGGPSACATRLPPHHYRPTGLSGGAGSVFPARCS